MRTKTIPSSWIQQEGLRLDCGPYMSGALEAKVILESLSAKTVLLQEVTLGGRLGLVNAGRIKRMWVNDPAFGKPFLSSTDILQADLSNLRHISSKAVKANPKLIIREGWTLITRAGTIGRMAYTRPDMDGMACTEDVLRVIPDPEKIPPGYLYTYLSSKFGVPLVVGGTYGAIIQHVEPDHVADLPVPRFEKDFERQIDENIRQAASNRVEYQRLLRKATSELFQSLGISELSSNQWHSSGPELGFLADVSNNRTLRASNYMPRVKSYVERLKECDHKLLGDICRSGHLGTGARFKRIDCAPKYGVRLIGQKQGFWMRPDGRWISQRHAPKDIFAENETVMVASSGTLGEHELYCRSLLITGEWLKHVYTQHFLRIVSGDPDISGAYLFAFFRSELAFRILRSYSTGSKQQEVHLSWLSELPIPLVDSETTYRIEKLVRKAFLLRDSADLLEDDAVRLVEEKIEAAS